MSKRSRAIVAIGSAALAFGAFGVAATSDEFGYVGAVGFVGALYVGLALVFGMLWLVMEWIDRGNA